MLGHGWPWSGRATEDGVITKEQLLASMRHETNVIKHLATKIRPDRLDWRPTPGQRSIAELLQYLTVAALIPAQNLISGDWGHAEAMSAEAASVTLDTFGDAMDRQMERLDAMIRRLDVADALESDARLPWGAPIKQGQGFVDMALKTLVAYRMQLFLYAKQACDPELDSANCWVGVDRPRAS